MRSKTFVRGRFISVLCIITMLFMSGRMNPGESPVGFVPGDRLPSIKVNGLALSDSLSSKCVLIFWSHKDAVARATNALISHQLTDTYSIYSICTDADQEESEFFAKMDNLNSSTIILGAKGLLKEMVTPNHPEFSALEGHIFLLDKGIIQNTYKASELWKLYSTQGSYSMNGCLILRSS